jgi:hypothetical protein
MLNIILSVCGLLLKIWLVTYAYIAYKTSYGTSINFQMLRSELKKYMLFSKLPEKTRSRLLTFYDASFDGHFFRRNEINKILGDKLQLSIKIDCYGELVRSNSFFQMIPDEMIPAVVNAMTEVRFLNDEVLSFNQSEVYFYRETTILIKSHEFN